MLLTFFQLIQLDPHLCKKQFEYTFILMLRFIYHKMENKGLSPPYSHWPIDMQMHNPLFFLLLYRRTSISPLSTPLKYPPQ